ncbi:MAG: hypothetical protein LW604_05035 [Sediminibacterium sp.]|jgi:uncharacterized membrane protein|nr:hypothetical protein [Sediminibacterium sp.]
MKIKILQQILFFILIAFYIFAGYNHFASPSFYLPIIPPYLSNWANEINLLSGILEIILGILLLPKSTRSYAAKGIIILLVLFIPSHIYFIQKGSFTLGAIEITPTLSWFRLLIGQPILMLWAWWASKIEIQIFKKFF